MTESPTMERLPPGQHGLSRDFVKKSQRQRLMAAAAESLAEDGYGRITLTRVAKRAGVSTASFYQHFPDLRACLLASYEVGAQHLCERIENACATSGGGEKAAAAIAGGLALLASEPALTNLLSAEPPSSAAALWEARLRLSARLAALLRIARGGGGDGEREARLVGGALSLVSITARSEGGKLEELAPSLARFLLAPR